MRFPSNRFRIPTSSSRLPRTLSLRAKRSWEIDPNSEKERRGSSLNQHLFSGDMLVLRSVIFQFFLFLMALPVFSPVILRAVIKNGIICKKNISTLVIVEGVIHHYPSLKQHDLSISPQKRGQKSQLSGRSAGECGGLGWTSGFLGVFWFLFLLVLAGWISQA